MRILCIFRFPNVDLRRSSLLSIQHEVKIFKIMTGKEKEREGSCQFCQTEREAEKEKRLQ